MSEIKKRKIGDGKYKADIKTSDLYNYYKENIPVVDSITGKGKTSGAYDITNKMYSDILKDINNAIISLIILENFEFDLPFKLGHLSLKQRKIKFKLTESGELDTRYLNVDWKATNDLWNSNEESKKNKNLIFFTNEHTNGNRMSYWWSKKGASTVGIKAYYFLPSRDMKRKAAKFLQDTDLRLGYYEMPKPKEKFIYKKK